LTILAIIGLLGLGSMAFAQEKPSPTPPAKPGQPASGSAGPMQRLANWLKLTPDQVTKFKDFQKANQEGHEAFQAQMKKLGDELGPLMKDGKSDLNKINGLIDQIGKLSTERIKRGYQNARNLEKILTPDQLDKLKRAGAILQGFGMGLRQGLGMRGSGQGRGMGQGPGMRGGLAAGQGRGMMNQPRATNMVNRLRKLGQKIQKLRGIFMLWRLGW
jgi:Spy/CpxP family protein refolding chaperone